MKTLLLLFTIFFNVSCWQKTSPPSTEQVKLGNVKKTVQLIGRAYSLTRNVITAPFDSKVSGLKVRLGESVVKGQHLIVLNSTDIIERFKSQRLTINRNNSQLASYGLQIRKLKTDLKRDREAVKLRVVASAQVDDLAYQLSVAESEWLSIKAANQLEVEKLKDMEKTLGEGNLRAPIDGTVIDMWVNHTDFYDGIIVRSGDPLVTIASRGPMKVKALAPEFLTAALIDKQAVTVMLNSDDKRSWPGTVVSIKPPAVRDEDSAGNFEVIVDFNPPDNTIRNGLEALIIANVATRINVPTLPKSAIQTVGTSNFVIKRTLASTKSKNSISQKVEVKLGIIGDETVEIKSGLSIGDEVLRNYEEPN